MDKAMMMKAALIFLALALADFVFTFRYYHYAKDNGLLGKEFNEETKKPLVSVLWGVLGADLLFASIVFFVLGLLK